MDLNFYNTESRSKQKFIPLVNGHVSMYNCGPTVYSYAHIGNLRAYVFADTLRRTLEWNGYKVKQIINITDVGHLVTDGDEGEDKMEVGARREGKSVEQIISQYSEAFYKDLNDLNILPAEAYPRASKFIDCQRQMVEVLHTKGYTYLTSDGIYFDSSKFPDYAKFAKLDVEGLDAGQRVTLGEKKHATDFALWKFSPNDGGKREQEWASPITPERMGFPGWHIECSAIVKELLGDTIDIHTGGVDHIPVHHSNEIAQSVCANDSQFVRFWLHCQHMLVDHTKMSKSLGNVYQLDDLKQRGIPPLAFRYWLLTAHYRTQANFTWEALSASQVAYNKLINIVLELPESAEAPAEGYLEEFTREINDDLNTANALALIWKLLKDTTISDASKYQTILKFDEVLGLNLSRIKQIAQTTVVPSMVSDLVQLREVARSKKDFVESDRLRDEIDKLGFIIKDTPQGQKITPK